MAARAGWCRGGSRRLRTVLTGLAFAAGVTGVGLYGPGLSSAGATNPCGTTGVLTPGTCTYTTPGADTFNVPPGVTSVQVVAIGAPGGAGGGSCTGCAAGGFGAVVNGNIAPTGSTLTVAVAPAAGAGAGGAGYPGGSCCPTGAGGSGGGQSRIKDGSTLLVLAGGGGGGGGQAGVTDDSATGGAGGNAGGSSDGNGGAGAGAFGVGINGDDGGVGTQSGTHGSGSPSGTDGIDGTARAGGSGGQGGTTGFNGGGGGGGGGDGYVGGGGGGGGADGGGGGGGGGASYVASSVSNSSIATDTTGTASVTITWEDPTTTSSGPASGSITYGTGNSDSATVQGDGTKGSPTGTVSFFACGPSATDCSSGGSAFGSAVTVTAGTNSTATAGSATFMPSAAGSWCFRAVYSGDSNYMPSSDGGSDECFSVSAATTGLSTTAQPNSASVGTTFKDQATLSGGASPTGTITFKLYGPNNSSCTTNLVDTETAAVSSGNGNYTTPNGYVANTAGTYQWLASYGGDGNNAGSASSCGSEPVTVSAAITGLSTTAQPSNASLSATLKDQATLSGGVSPTGTITFKLYGPNNSSCTTNLVDTETAAVSSGNGSYTTPNGYVANTAGTYQWLASYGGDGNNAGSASSCGSEPVVVSATTGLSTTAQPNSASVGTTFKDQATLSGGASPTGTITFKLYGPNNSSCTTNLVDTETAAVSSGNGNYTTPSGYVANTAGTYQWLASYGGDANNAGSASSCGSEPVTVSAAITGLSTTAQPSNASLSATLKDQATLSGGVSPTGTITFKLYGPNNSSCTTNLVDTETAAVSSGNGSYTTPNGYVANTAGTYQWLASYGGDANNAGSASSCGSEPVVVSSGSTSTTYEDSDPSVSFDGWHGVVDSSANGGTYEESNVSGQTAKLTFTATGITWASHKGPDQGIASISIDGTSQANVDLYSATPGAFSTSYTGLSSGSHQISIKVSGTKNAASSNTNVSVDAFIVGSTATQDSSPTIQYDSWQGYSNASASGGSYRGSGTAGATSSLTFSGTSVTWVTSSGPSYGQAQVYIDGVATGGTIDLYASSTTWQVAKTFSGLSAGTHTISIHVLGTKNSSSSGTKIIVDAFTVTGGGGGPATTTMTTTAQPNTANAGATLKDQATLAGGVSPTGTITFKLYGPNNSSCTTNLVDTETAAVSSGNGNYTTPNGYVANTAGTYQWLASYGGDGNNAGSASSCGSEPVTVSAAITGLSTTAQPSSASLSATLKDQATLSGGVSPTGTITFKLYGPNNSSCTTNLVDTETAAVSSGNGSYTTPNGYVANTAGTYQWLASYGGDANNAGSNSSCGSEPVTVTSGGPATTALTTTAQPSSASVGMTFKDQATLSGGASPTGTITFKLYGPNNSSCTTNLVDTETAAVSSGNGNYTTPSGYVANTAGTYQWLASYGGDANNAGSASSCGSEPVTVSAAITGLSTTAQPSNASLSATLKDQATLSGGVSPTGTITFKLYGPNNSSCTTNLVDTETAAVSSGNGSYTTPNGYVANTAGTYQWLASYGGDANNAGSASSCGSEPVVVSSGSTSTTYEDSDPSVSFDGWHGVVDSSANGGTYEESNVSGQTAKLTFTATGITWASHKGPDQGIASISIDGTSQANVDLYSATPGAFSTSYTGLSSGSHQISIKVSGTKNAASSNTNVSVDAFIVGSTATQDSSPTIQYDSWQGYSNASASGGSYRGSGTAGATSSLTFSGTSVTWVTSSGPSYGQAQVYIDGVATGGTIDLYASSTTWQVAKTFSGLSAGTHTISIHVLGTKNSSSSGTKIIVDAFTVS